MVCFLIRLISIIVSTRLHGNTIFLRGLRSYKILGSYGVLNLYSIAILIVDLSFDIDLEF